MIATHKYSPPKTGSIKLPYSPPSIHYIHKLYTCIQIAFSAGLQCIHVEWACKNTTNSAILHPIVHGTCFNQSCASRSLPYLKFGVTETREGTGTVRAIHFEPHTFHIFRILARPAAFVGTWLDIADSHNSVFLTPCKPEIPYFAYREFNAGIHVINCQLNVDIL